MLYIITTSKMFGKLTQEWHVGEPIPQSVYERVVTFKADGDELDLFTDAMLATRAATNGPIWKKGTGFQPASEEKKNYRVFWAPSTISVATGTGIVYPIREAAETWIKLHPAHDGVWSVREENA